MVKIDRKDREILYQLDLNSRQSFAKIGKQVGLPKTVVAYRINKLKDANIIKTFYTVIDAFKLGYTSLRIYLVFQYTTEDIENEIIQYFSQNKLNWWTISAEGRFDLAVIMWVKNINDFYAFWEKTLRKYRDYFQEQQFSAYIQAYNFRNTYLLGETNKTERIKMQITAGGKPVKTDDLDFQILKILGPNARMPIREIASTLNTTVSIVNYRINKLVNQGVIQGFRTDIDLFKLGYQFFKADIYLRDYQKRGNIINYVRTNPYLVRIDRSIGISDLELEFHVKSINHFHDIMHELINKYRESIKNYKYVYASKLHNMNYLPEV